MSITEGKLDVGTTGEELDTTKVTQTDGSVVHREAVVIADPIKFNARMRLEPYPFVFEDRYALPVTGPEIKALADLIGELLQEQRLTNLHMSRLSGEELTVDDIEDY